MVNSYLVARGLQAVARLGALWLAGRPTAGSAPYYDLLGGLARRFWGDNLHFGYFEYGAETLTAAHEAHTDLVAGLARVPLGGVVLDVGCGLAVPAMRIAQRCGCQVVAVDLSAGQVRRARALVAARGLGHQVTVARGDGLRLPFPDHSFDAVVCLEVAADICASDAQRSRLVAELWRVLRPGGHVGFTDFALREPPPTASARVLWPFLCAGDPRKMVCDWPTVFRAGGFELVQEGDIFAATQPTWPRIAERFDRLASMGGVVGRLAGHVARRLRDAPAVLDRYATYPALSAHKELPIRAGLSAATNDNKDVATNDNGELTVARGGDGHLPAEQEIGRVGDWKRNEGAGRELDGGYGTRSVHAHQPS